MAAIVPRIETPEDRRESAALRKSIGQLTTHLTPSQREELDTRIATIASDKVNELVENLNSTPFKDSKSTSKRNRIWDPEQFEDIQMVSYKALKDGKISLDQFVTCSLVSYMFQQFKAKYLRIIPNQNYTSTRDNKVNRHIVSKNPQVLDSIFDVIDFDESNARELVERFVTWSYPSYIDREQKTKSIIEELVKKVKDMPQSEQRFFSYDIPINNIDEVSPMLDILVNRAKLPFIKESIDEHSLKILFPSYSIAIALLDIANPNGAKPTPVFGEMSTIDIRKHFLRGNVPINLPVFDVAELIKENELIQSADGHFSGPSGYAWHDIYHLWKKTLLSSGELDKTQKMIKSLNTLRNELRAINSGRKEMTSDIESLLNEKFKSGTMQDKITKAIKQLGKDVWNLSDLDIIELTLDGKFNIKYVYEHASPLAQSFIDANRDKIGVTQSELLGIIF